MGKFLWRLDFGGYSWESMTDWMEVRWVSRSS